MDIAREFLSKYEKRNEKLEKLFEILKETKESPFEPLSSFLIDLSDERKFELDDDKIYRDPTLSTKTNTLSVSNKALGTDFKVKKRILIKSGDLVIGKMHTQNGSFAISDQEYVSTGTFVPFQIDKTRINPKYLFISLKPAFEKLGIDDSTGRETYKTEEILSLQIPLPTLETQNEIVEKIEKQKQIIVGAEKIESYFTINNELFFGDKMFFKDVVESTQIGLVKTVEETNKGDIEYIKMTNIQSGFVDYSKITTIKASTEEIRKYTLENNDILLNTRNSIELVGKTAIYKKKNKKPVLFNHMLMRIKTVHKVLPEYLNYCFLSNFVAEQLNGIKKASTNIAAIYEKDLKNILFLIPPLPIQREIVEKLDQQMQALDGVHLLKSEAKKRIQEILSAVWGNE